MKTQDLLIYGGLGYLAYRFLFKEKPAPTPATETNGVQADTPMLDTSNVGLNGKIHWRYVGSSALRVDANGQPIYCGAPGMPFAVSGIEGQFAKTAVAPTTFYAMLEIGDEQSVNEGYTLPEANAGGKHLKPGDTIDLKVTGGQFSALDGQRVTVLQLGSDTCTSAGTIEGKNNFVVVDIPIIMEGADDSQYPAQEGSGYAVKVNF